MARNKIVYLKDIENELKIDGIKSKYWVNKELYISKKYNDLFLKDIVVDKKGFVYGVCNCDCGERDLVTAIKPLLDGKTKTCKSCISKPCIGKRKSKYADNYYIGKVYGFLEVLTFYHGTNGNRSGVMWKLRCLNCGAIVDRFASLVANKNSTTISCGCVGVNRNNKYSIESYVGTYVNGTKVLRLLPKDYDKTGSQFWECECKYCGKPYIRCARHIVYGHVNSCGCQTESLGVLDISRFLKEHNIKYKKEYTFTDLYSKNGHKLRYDFGILDIENNLLGLIEYDGLFHYSIEKSFGRNLEEKTKNFEDVYDSDTRKNNYAKENSIPLLRIIYSRKTEQILDKLITFLKELDIL